MEFKTTRLILKLKHQIAILVNWIWVFCILRYLLTLISDVDFLDVDIHQTIWFEQKCRKMGVVTQIQYNCNLQYLPKRLVSDKSTELHALRALPITDTRLTCLRAYAPYPSLIRACGPLLTNKRFTRLFLSYQICFKCYWFSPL